MPAFTCIFGSADANNLQQMLKAMREDSSQREQSHAAPALAAAAAVVSKTETLNTGLAWNDSRDIACLLSGDPQLDLHNGDTLPRTFLRVYEKNGIDALLQLNGWFAGVLFDLRSRRAILFNDRYGLCRVYVHEAAGQIGFASQAKALLAAKPDLRSIDPQGVADWISCGCTLQNRSLFSGISLLPPGSAWIHSPGAPVEKKRYFDPAQWESQPRLSAADYERRLAEVFPRALDRACRGGSVAMSITGGLDGRMIMAWARRSNRSLPCYTFNGPHRNCADFLIGQHVAKTCGQSHHEIAIGQEFLSRFPELAEQSVYISDGAMDVTGAAEIYANRLAREIAPIRLTGNYGSEIVRRNVAFRPRPISANIFAPEIVQRGTTTASTYAAESSGDRLSFIAFKQVPWHHYARFSVEQSQITVRSPFLDNDLVSACFQAPAESQLALEPTLRVIAAGDAELARIPTDRGVTWPAASGAVNHLRKKFHDNVARAEYAYDYGMPDWLARVDSVLAPLRLERLFLGRQKFVHFRSWYRHELANYIKDLLLDPRSLSRSYLNRTAIESTVMGHIRGTHNRTLEIHKLLSLELLHRTLIDQ